MDSSSESEESDDVGNNAEIDRDVDDDVPEEEAEEVNSPEEDKADEDKPPSSPSQQQTQTQTQAQPCIPIIRPEVLTASVYDIVPTIAAPHSTSINALTATPDLKWVFSGGSDGYIRKFNWIETANGKMMLTVAQRHPFVDSVTKAGVLVNYWEGGDENNESTGEASASSSVFSLAVQKEALWLLSGLGSGAINLQSVRYDEGKQISVLRGHKSAVSALSLAEDGRSCLSGSWDKIVYDWDLETGKTIRSFAGSGGQISALEVRPLSALPVPFMADAMENGVAGSPAADPLAPKYNGTMVNGLDHEGAEVKGEDGGTFKANLTSPADSLFGGDGDSLFGDGDTLAPATGAFDDDDGNEFSRAIATDLQQNAPALELPPDADGDIIMESADAIRVNASPTHEADQKISSPEVASSDDGQSQASQTSTVRKSSVAEDEPDVAQADKSPLRSDDGSTIDTPKSDSVFLAASIDGSIRIWDKRQQAAVAKLTPRNVPPWCMNACWSPDGNTIYAGRRNGTVDEYSLTAGLQNPSRNFKLPGGSGPVSAVRAMPNGRHLICASYDILRLYDLHEQQIFKHATVPFLIIPGHRTSVISQLYIDPSCRYLLTSGGHRGWQGATSEVLLGYEIGVPKSG